MGQILHHFIFIIFHNKEQRHFPRARANIVRNKQKHSRHEKMSKLRHFRSRFLARPQSFTLSLLVEISRVRRIYNAWRAIVLAPKGKRAEGFFVGELCGERGEERERKRSTLPRFEARRDALRKARKFPRNFSKSFHIWRRTESRRPIQRACCAEGERVFFVLIGLPWHKRNVLSFWKYFRKLISLVSMVLFFLFCCWTVLKRVPFHVTSCQNFDVN